MNSPKRKTMKKTAAKLIVAIGLITAGLLMSPGQSHAAGEQYSFQDSTQKTIIGSGGAYTSPVTFSQTGQSTYQAQYNINCNGQPIPLALSLASNSTATPVSGTLTYTPPSGCDPNLDKTISIAAPSSSSSGQCDASVFSWFVCPMTQAIQTDAAKIADFVLPPLLRIDPLTPHNTPGIYQAWQGVRDFANTLLVLAFLIIAFANALSFQLDNYAVKRALPRLVMAAILVQFSFFLSGIVIDIGNVLGAGIGDLIGNFASTNGTPFHHMVQAGIFNAIGLGAGIALGVIFWPLAGLLALSLIISLAVIFLTLGARFLLLYALIVLSPLAFVAWVLPSTQSYFSKWWRTFTRLILMYPIIMAILAIAGLTNSLLGSANQLTTGGGGVAASVAVSALKLVVGIAAFFMIPQTFRWAGGMMAHAHQAIGGIGGIGKSRLRESQWSKDQHQKVRERQLRRMDRLANTPEMMALSRSNSRVARGIGSGVMGTAGFLSGGAPSTALARARAHNALTKEHSEAVDTLNESIPSLNDALEAVYSNNATARAEARQRIERNAPSLLRYMESRQGRISIAKKLADLDLLGNDRLEEMLNSNDASLRRDYDATIQAISKIAPKKPAMVMRFRDGELDSRGRPQLRGVLKEQDLGRMVRGWTVSKLRDDIDRENFAIAAETTHIGNQVARQIADNLGAKVVRSVFSAGTASYADPAKRAAIIKMIHEKAHLFQASQNGKAIVREILEALETTDEDFMDQILLENHILTPAALATLDAAGKKIHVARWLS